MYIADSNRGQFQLPFANTDFTSGPPSPMFPHNSSNTFNSIGGDMTQLNLTSHGESGLDVLSHDVVGEALHDSCERFPEPACHLGTRTAVLEQLSAWSVDASTESTVMWLNGPAGVGKSAIAQMFAGNCQARGQLGASFFFKRGDGKRGTWHGLFPTIAYQLATSIPGLSLPIQQAVETDKLVARRAMPVQFKRLILEPFRQAGPLGILTVIVLDGLDECEDHTIQQQILRLFIDTLRGTHLPIRMLICSRPDPHLREVLETAQMSAICCHFVLSCDESAYQDIRIYLRDEFSRIHSDYRTRGIDLGTPWPSAEELEHLVQKSSGIFIYATTVIRFVGDEYSHPVDRLDSVLALDPQSTAPLDDLYKQILSLVPQSWQHLRILHAIWRETERLYFTLDPEEIDTLLTLRSGTTRLMLRGLHSLFDVHPVHSPFACRNGVKFLHASFCDHLGDPRRSGPWCVSLPGLQDDLLHSTIRFLSSPPLTYTTQELCRNLVIRLPGLLEDATPSETLFELMRNKTFQESLFLWCKLLEQPQRGSSYPFDLIQLWEDHWFISRLAAHLDNSGQTDTRDVATFKFDPIYATILSNHPNLVLVLTGRAFGLELDHILQVLGLSYNVLRPFLETRELLESPLSHKDSPVYFLADPSRSGGLMNEQATAEEIVLRWIVFTKKYLIRGEGWLIGYSIFSHTLPEFLTLIDRCGPNLGILHELKTLNFCTKCSKKMHQKYHLKLHQCYFHHSRLRHIVDWLWALDDPPMEVIQFWEQQIASMDQCYRTVRRDLGMEYYDEESDNEEFDTEESDTEGPNDADYGEE
ncbi:hypothetical protein C8J57DRAFT_1472125 [Mycena rebaudengoi]|nr:hypothetical protein C8J57DRAFT_1472125 [Mycena rebaudengoi]